LLHKALFSLNHSLNLLIGLHKLQFITVVLAEQAKFVATFAILCNEVLRDVSEQSIIVPEAESCIQVLATQALGWVV
jgi:hypothetical protein